MDDKIKNLLNKMIKNNTDSIALYKLLMERSNNSRDKLILKEILALTEKNNAMLQMIYSNITNTQSHGMRSLYIEDIAIDHNYIDALQKSYYLSNQKILNDNELLSLMMETEYHNKLHTLLINDIYITNLLNYLIITNT